MDTRRGETACFRWLDAQHDSATACGHAQIVIGYFLAMLMLGVTPNKCLDGHN